MKFLDRIFKGSSEHDVFDRSKAIIDHAANANKMLVEIINGSTDIAAIHDVEHKSDKEVFEIANSITAGAIAPNLIDDMTQFVTREDDML